jgi:hypothetical protein
MHAYNYIGLSYVGLCLLMPGKQYRIKCSLCKISFSDGSPTDILHMEVTYNNSHQRWREKKISVGSMRFSENF